MNKKIIIISGPTACGKTQTSINLAKLINENTGQAPHILNFDSLLFYRELNIGTAEPLIKEREGIPHHLIDITSAATPLDASSFVEIALSCMQELHDRGKIIILVGGSGFYLRALIKGMYQAITPSKELKDTISKKYKEDGIDHFLDFLKDHDPDSLEYLHKNDHYRIIRAYEYFKTTGKKISDSKKEKEAMLPYDFSSPQYLSWDIRVVI